MPPQTIFDTGPSISAISKLGGGFCALLLKFSYKRKMFKLDNYFNSNGFAPAHAQSVAYVSKHYLLKALIHLSRNIEDHAIAHFTHILCSFSFCNLFCTEKALEIGNFYFVAKL